MGRSGPDFEILGFANRSHYQPTDPHRPKLSRLFLHNNIEIVTRYNLGGGIRFERGLIDVLVICACIEINVCRPALSGRVMSAAFAASGISSRVRRLLGFPSD